MEDNGDRQLRQSSRLSGISVSEETDVLLSQCTPAPYTQLRGLIAKSCHGGRTEHKVSFDKRWRLENRFDEKIEDAVDRADDDIDGCAKEEDDYDNTSCEPGIGTISCEG